MARLKPDAGETYNRTPPPTPSSKQRSKSSSTATLSAPSSASPATASSSNQPRASPVASTSKALTPEEAQKLFEDESTCRQPWMRSESRGGWERFAENRAEVVSFAEQEETPLDATGETGGGQDTDEVGNDDIDEDVDATEEKPPQSVNEIIQVWTDDVAKDLFGSEGDPAAMRALELWPIFAQLIVRYAPDKFSYSPDTGIQRLRGVRSRSFAKPFFAFTDIVLPDGRTRRVQRAAIIFAFMVQYQPEWHSEFWKLDEDSLATWKIDASAIKAKNVKRKMIESDRFGVYSLIDEGIYIGATFRAFWARLLQHLYVPVSRKVAQARARRCLGKWACLEIFAIPARYESSIPHLVIFLIEFFWNTITRSATGINYNTNKLDSATWAGKATRGSIRRGMRKTWELLSREGPDGERQLIAPKSLTKDWIRQHPELIEAFGVGAIGGVIAILTGHRWAWLIRSYSPIPVPPEAYPTLRYPTQWQAAAERERFVREKRARHADPLYAFLQTINYESERKSKRRKSDEGAA